MKNDIMYYSVGALLYCPADRPSIAQSVIQEKFGRQYSLALCLEDTINDNFVAEAEEALLHSLRRICSARRTQNFYLPKIFIRVRNREQISRLVCALDDCISVIIGFILPKFTPANAEGYIDAVLTANRRTGRQLYMMPILESAEIVDLRTRHQVLYSLRETLGQTEELVLNIRVGGNDLCNLFGFRRSPDESIHEIKPVSSIFADIVTVFGADYVISAPVWEYYGGPGWESGLAAEIRGDKLCGFKGKTVIHPRQIEVVNDCFKVSPADFEDARRILGWDQSSGSFVSGSGNGTRMNEYKTHQTWAREILCLAQVYGILTE